MSSEDASEHLKVFYDTYIEKEFPLQRRVNSPNHERFIFLRSELVFCSLCTFCVCRPFRVIPDLLGWCSGNELLDCSFLLTGCPLISDAGLCGSSALGGSLNSVCCCCTDQILSHLKLLTGTHHGERQEGQCLLLSKRSLFETILYFLKK